MQGAKGTRSAAEEIADLAEDMADLLDKVVAENVELRAENAKLKAMVKYHEDIAAVWQKALLELTKKLGGENDERVDKCEGQDAAYV